MDDLALLVRLICPDFEALDGPTFGPIGYVSDTSVDQANNTPFNHQFVLSDYVGQTQPHNHFGVSHGTIHDPSPLSSMLRYPVRFFWRFLKLLYVLPKT
jgi:hypothetical protein